MTQVLTDFDMRSRARFEAGMRRPRSKVWYRAMATRLRIASHAYKAVGCEGYAVLLMDRAVQCSFLAGYVV